MTAKQNPDTMLRFLDFLPDGVMIWERQPDNGIRLRAVNREFTRMFPNLDADALQDTPINDFFQDNPKIIANVIRTLNSGDKRSEQKRLHLGDRDDPMWVRLDYIPRPFEGAWSDQSEWVMLLMRDITRVKAGEVSLKRAREQLEERVKERTAELTEVNTWLQEEVEQRRSTEAKLLDYQNLVESSDDPMLLVDDTNRVRLANASFLALFQLERAGVDGKEAAQILSDSKLADRIQKRITMCLNGSPPPVQFENIVRRRDSDSRHMQLAYYPVRNGDNRIHGAVVIFKDTTELVRAEMALKTFKEVLDKAGYGALIVDLSGNIIYVNKSYAQMHLYALDDLVSKHASVFHSEAQWDYLEQLFKLMTETSHGFTDEIWHRRRDGREFPAMMTGTVVENDQGEPQYISMTAIDITAKREAEEQIRHSLKEKEVLLKEIHHRVKNNLQIISSLLNLQAAMVDSPKLRNMLLESQNRVKSMALIHDRLYREKNFARIDFTEYARDIVENLFHSYSEDTDRITFSMDFQKIWLDFDLAIPLGLIINEIVSNSLKYAFPEDRGGSVRLTFTSEGEESYRLVVVDDGVGLPEGMDISELDSLGMKLVHTLVDQLEGDIEMVSDGGTRFTITFEYEESLWPTAGGG